LQRYGEKVGHEFRTTAPTDNAVIGNLDRIIYAIIRLFMSQIMYTSSIISVMTSDIDSRLSC